MPERIPEHEKRLDKLELWRNGNGAVGAEERLQELEIKCVEANCQVGKNLRFFIEETKNNKEGQVDAVRWEKQMRQTRITNILGFLGLGVMIFVAMMWGG